MKQCYLIEPHSALLRTNQNRQCLRTAGVSPTLLLLCWSPHSTTLTSHLQCGNMALWLLLLMTPLLMATYWQGFTVTSATGQNNHQITITWILITQTCSHQSALFQIHASLRHSLSGLLFTTPNSSPTQCALPVYTYLSQSRRSSSDAPTKYSIVPGSRSPPILQLSSVYS